MASARLGRRQPRLWIFCAACRDGSETPAVAALPRRSPDTGGPVEPSSFTKRRGPVVRENDSALFARFPSTDGRIGEKSSLIRAACVEVSHSDSHPTAAIEFDIGAVFGSSMIIGPNSPRPCWEASVEPGAGADRD